MKNCSFKLSAVAVSILVGFSGAAMAATTPAVKDVSSLSKNTQGYYTGGGAVFIGGSDLTVIKDGQTGAHWEAINTDTAGFGSLVNSSGFKGYLEENYPSLAYDANYVIDEDYQRAVHGERLAKVGREGAHSIPVGMIDSLKMGTEDSRYVKTQSVTLYQRDASGNILYQKDDKGAYVTDTKGNRVPLTVSKTVVLDQNSDVYIRPVESEGGQFGLQNSAIYSKVKSLTSDIAAVTTTGNLQEHNANNRKRDVFVVKNTIIDNTLDEDAAISSPSNGQDGDEHHYTTRPWATGLAINANSVDYEVDAKGNIISNGATSLTHQVAATPNVILSNAQITAKNLAAVRSDDNGYHNQNDYNTLADKKSTAVAISGSGLFVSIADNSTLTGGVNNAGKSLTVSGHANRVDVNSSTLNGGVVINHDGHAPVISVAVVKDSKTGDYVATGASINDHSLVSRDRNGTTLNVSNNSVINGDITASGTTQYFVQLVDVTDAKAHVVLSDAQVQGSTSAHAIYDNAVGSVSQTILANAGNAYTPVAVNLDHSTLNGAVKGITNVLHSDNTPVVSWNPDLSVKNGSVWNAAATAEGNRRVVSNVHDLNLSDSTLNLVNLETDRPTLGDQGRHEDLGSARVVVHNTLTQDKDSNGNYLTSQINVGKAVVNPLLDVGGHYALGSLQVKGAVTGNYLLDIANSGVEPYVKNGYLAEDGQSGTQPHSFVNYLDKGSDAHFSGRTELGVYQYDVVNELNDSVHNEHNVYFKNNGQLSNSASMAQSLQASQVSIANMESDALHQRMKASRHANDAGGVWASYYGGSEHNKTNSGAAYRVRTNGFMLGADTQLDAQQGGSWLAGLAFSSGNSDVNTMNSKGDIDNYGMQFYVSRRWDNGMFVDTQAQFTHFSNDARVNMLDGQRAQADYSGNGYGLGMKLGYTWEQDNFFAEPYLQATGRTFDGATYALSNGMVVNGEDYKSMVGEVGVDLGYTFNLDSGSYIKPYLHLAGMNEFADGNTMRLNNVSVDNSIDGGAFQIGLGTEVKLMNNVGGYAGFNYTTGSDIERPWQANVGVSYTW